MPPDPLLQYLLFIAHPMSIIINMYLSMGKNYCMNIYSHIRIAIIFLIAGNLCKFTNVPAYRIAYFTACEF